MDGSGGKVQDIRCNKLGQKKLMIDVGTEAVYVNGRLSKVVNYDGLS